MCAHSSFSSPHCPRGLTSYAFPDMEMTGKYSISLKQRTDLGCNTVSTTDMVLMLGVLIPQWATVKQVEQSSEGRAFREQEPSVGGGVEQTREVRGMLKPNPTQTDGRQAKGGAACFGGQRAEVGRAVGRSLGRCRVHEVPSGNLLGTQVIWRPAATLSPT